MKTAMTSLLGKLCGGASVAIVGLGLTVGAAQTARANDVELLAPTPQEAVVAPIVKAMDVLVERIARLEESVALFAATISSQRVATRQLCVQDETGAETCLTKAQLDGLLKRFAQAEVSEPAVIVAIAAPAAEPQQETAAPAAELQANEAPAADNPAAEPQAAEAPAADDRADAAPPEGASTTADAIETIPAREEYASAAAVTSEPNYTGSTAPETEGAALVWYPEVEVTVAGSAAPEWSAPAEE